MNRKETSGRRMTREKRLRMRRRRRRRRILALIVELIVLAALLIAAYVIMKLKKVNFHSLDADKLEAYRDTGPYTNIALFGLDSREGEIEGGVQSDCIMIASINNETGEVKIASVYRDTLLQQADGSYEKANAAYNRGGPQEAVSLLNRNLDLDIHNYVSVNFNALVDAIDLLGGIELDLTEEEVYWTNGYCAETSRIVGHETTELTKAGRQTLDGIQAVSYSRIRYTAGDDFKRTQRQRIVLEETARKAKKADLFTLSKIVDQVFPQISTSFSINQLLGFAAHGAGYEITDMSGFPFQVTASESVLDHWGSYVVPIDLAANVRQLHAWMFGEEDYVPSEKVTAIGNDIIYLTGVTADSQAIDTDFDSDEDGAAQQTEE